MACRLCCVHGKICGAQQRPCVVPVVWISPDANAAADMNLMTFYIEWLAQGSNQLLSHFFDLLDIGDHWKGDDEFIPA
jgi:hypothetical protein